MAITTHTPDERYIKNEQGKCIGSIEFNPVENQYFFIPIPSMVYGASHLVEIGQLIINMNEKEV